MNIPSAKYLKVKAANRLESGKDPQRVVLIYSAIVAVSALAVNSLNFFLDSQISQTGGLQNIGTRSFLSTLNSVFPLVQMLVIACLTLGYNAAMLRVVRRQFVSEKTMKAGFERFWVLLRTRILQGLIYFGLAFALCYLALAIYMVTPYSSRLTDFAQTIASRGVLSMEALMNDDALILAAYDVLMPAMVIYSVLLIAAVWFVSYRFRLVDYLLIDQPQLGAFGALRTSRQKMKGNIKRLFKLDLSFWWYYLLRGLISTVLLYGNILLDIFGILVPLSSTAMFFVTVIVYLAADFAMNYFLMNRVQASYALFYDMLNPQQPPQEGVVLGSIFQ